MAGSGFGFGPWRGRRRIAAKRKGSGPPDILIDSDTDSDTDDINDQLAWIAMHKAGKCVIRSHTLATRSDASPGFVKAFYDTVGLFDVLVGVYKGSLSTIDGSEIGYAVAKNRFGYTGTTRSSWDDAAIAMRKALVDSSDGNAVIFTGGTMTNVAALLATSADDISPLTGVELVALKCKYILGNGSGWLTPLTLYGDLQKDTAAAEFTRDNSPVPIIWLDSRNGISDRFVTMPAAIDRSINAGAWAWDEIGYGPRPPFSFSGIFYACDTDAFNLHLGLSAPGNVFWSENSPYQVFTADSLGNSRYVILQSGHDGFYEIQCQALLDLAATQLAAEAADKATMIDRYRMREYLPKIDTRNQVCTDRSRWDGDLQLGTTLSANADDPTVGAIGLVFDGTDDFMTETPTTKTGFFVGRPTRMFVAVIKSTSFSGTDQIDYCTSSSAQAYQFRLVNGIPQLLSSAGNTLSGVTALTIGQWSLVVAIDDNRSGAIRINRVTDATTTFSTLPTASGTPSTRYVGWRTGTEYLQGELAYLGLFALPSEYAEDVEAYVTTLVASELGLVL